MAVSTSRDFDAPISAYGAGSIAERELADFWLNFTAMAGNGLDRLSLIVPDAQHPQGNDIYHSYDWIDLWAARSTSVATSALAEARKAGAARATLTMTNAAGIMSFWDTVLSRMVGRDLILCAARDVSERILQEKELRRVAYHDGLTGLLNRIALKNRLGDELATAERNGGSVTLFMLDLDNFKLINDTLGHDAGDTVLVEAAARLLATVPAEHAVGRLGGDEFAVITSGKSSSATTAFLAEDLLQSLRRPVLYKGRMLETRASIGVATFPQHGADVSQLLKNADIALYAAKSFGRGGFTTYVPSMGNALLKRAMSVSTVREAVAQHRLEAFYQPMINLSCNAVVGYEAVLRLREANGTLIPPGAINHAFDDIDLARQIGDMMLDRVADDVQCWQNAGVSVGRIALNASAADFRAGDFASRFLDKLRRVGLSPELFEIEIAETVLAGRCTDYVATALADLADAGLHVALDEFGTGASSLAQLKHLPFHSLKIDRTFVGTLEDDNDDKAIVRAIVGLADGLGLGMTAVGVETPGQIDALRTLGCKFGQGEFLGPPVNASAVGIPARPFTGKRDNVSL